MVNNENIKIIVILSHAFYWLKTTWLLYKPVNIYKILFVFYASDYLPNIVTYES